MSRLIVFLYFVNIEGLEGNDYYSYDSNIILEYFLGDFVNSIKDRRTQLNALIMEHVQKDTNSTLHEIAFLTQR